MNSAPIIDVPALIDGSRISPFQAIVLILCGLCVMLDGFDVQLIGYAAPAILAEWKIDKASLGPVFGAGLAGLLLSAMFLSMLADRIGRRPALIGCTIFFSISTLLTNQVTTIGALQILRFITGLGLGSILPGAIALAGEYSPLRQRVTLLTVVSVCFAVGGSIAGFVSAAVIPRWGWQSAFYVGGIAPAILTILMLFYLPESMQFLAARGKHALVGKWLKRIVPAVALDNHTKYRIDDSNEAGSSVAQLFTEGRARKTLILWSANFLNLIGLYFLSNWLPTIAKDSGLTISAAVLAGTALQVGGAVGSIVLGLIIDRVGFRRVLIPCFVAAAASIFFIGHPGISLPLLFAAITAAGVCVIGGQSSLVALAASSYPTTLRATGVGWSLGIGRLGSILGPVLGGELIRLNWPASSIFTAVAIPAVLSAVVLSAMERDGRPARANAPAA